MTERLTNPVHGTSYFVGSWLLGRHRRGCHQLLGIDYNVTLLIDCDLFGKILATCCLLGLVVHFFLLVWVWIAKRLTTLLRQLKDTSSIWCEQFMDIGVKSLFM